MIAEPKFIHVCSMFDRGLKKVFDFNKIKHLNAYKSGRGVPCLDFGLRTELWYSPFLTLGFIKTDHLV
jgi:hypothetical protein